MTHHFFFFFFSCPIIRATLILEIIEFKFYAMNVETRPVQCGPYLTPLFSGPTLSYVTVRHVQSRSQTLRYPCPAERENEDLGKIRLNSRFHWPLTERAQFHRKLINKQRTIIFLPDFQYSMPREMDVQALGTIASRANMAYKQR